MQGASILMIIINFALASSSDVFAVLFDPLWIYDEADWWLEPDYLDFC